MANLNEVRLIGSLTRDPEVRMTTNGHQITSFGLATNRKFKGNDGVQREEVIDGGTNGTVEIGEKEETEENLVQDTIPGCEPVYETTEERLVRLESELATLTRKKIILKGIKKHIDDEEKVIHEKILECLNEQKSPLLVKMMEAVFPREKAKVEITLIDRGGEEIVAGGDGLADQEVTDQAPDGSGEENNYGEWLRVSDNHRVLHLVANGNGEALCVSARSDEWTDPGDVVRRCRKCEAAYEQLRKIDAEAERCQA